MLVSTPATQMHFAKVNSTELHLPLIIFSTLILSAKYPKNCEAVFAAVSIDGLT